MPKAKTERLIVREIDDETLVYDLVCNAGTFWRQCDGETSVDELTAALGEDKHATGLWPIAPGWMPGSVSGSSTGGNERAASRSRFQKHSAHVAAK